MFICVIGFFNKIKSFKCSQANNSTLSTIGMGLQKLVLSASERKKASIEKEYQFVGSVSSSTYKAYLKSVDSKWLVLLYLSMQVVKIAADVVMRLSLGWWSDSRMVGQHDYYIQQYGASLVFSVFSTLGANVLLAIMMVTAST